MTTPPPTPGPATDAMRCRSCDREERASEGEPCGACGTFICLLCGLRGVVLCRACAERLGKPQPAPITPDWPA